MSVQQVLTMTTSGADVRASAYGWSAADPRGLERGQPAGTHRGLRSCYSYDTVLHAMADGWRLLSPPAQETDGSWCWWLVREAGEDAPELTEEQAAIGRARLAEHIEQRRESLRQEGRAQADARAVAFLRRKAKRLEEDAMSQPTNEGCVHLLAQRDRALSFALSIERGEHHEGVAP